MNAYTFRRVHASPNHDIPISTSYRDARTRPMLQYIIFLLAPIPYVFLSPSSIFEMATAPATTGWEDVGKFLIGVAGVGAVAVPTMLLHLGVITAGAFIFEMAGLGCACAAGAIAAFAGGNQNDYFAL